MKCNTVLYYVFKVQRFLGMLSIWWNPCQTLQFTWLTTLWHIFYKVANMRGKLSDLQASSKYSETSITSPVYRYTTALHNTLIKAQSKIAWANPTDLLIKYFFAKLDKRCFDTISCLKLSRSKIYMCNFTFYVSALVKWFPVLRSLIKVLFTIDNMVLILRFHQGNNSYIWLDLRTINTLFVFRASCIIEVKQWKNKQKWCENCFFDFNKTCHDYFKQA